MVHLILQLNQRKVNLPLTTTQPIYEVYSVCIYFVCTAAGCNFLTRNTNIHITNTVDILTLHVLFINLNNNNNNNKTIPFSTITDNWLLLELKVSLP